MTATRPDSGPRPAALRRARELRAPTREETLRRDSSVYQFWDTNEELLQLAWKEWDATSTADLPVLDDSLVRDELRHAVRAAWKSPTAATEAAVRKLWTEVAPGVFATQFLDTSRVSALRAWLDAAGAAGIPTRPPYGIVLNRRGAMLDARSVGHLAAPTVQAFYAGLVADYVRPLGRALFPRDIATAGEDAESFAFSIEYQGVSGGDKSIRPHSDASTVTFNINIDQEKTWTGSSLVFFVGDERHSVEWKPGMAVVHLGRTMHAALPIETGTRANWVIWTMGSEGPRRAYGQAEVARSMGSVLDGGMSVKERWTKQKTVDRKRDWQDRWSPF